MTRGQVQPAYRLPASVAYNPARFGDLAAYKAQLAGYQAASEKQLAEEPAPAN
jgi:hypothetical protein